MNITSPAFSDGGPIPRAHTCDGANMSPPLVWKDVPEATEELALIVDDPDAPGGTWVHWVLYKVPSTASSIPSGFPNDPETVTPLPARQGTNDFRSVGYGGPCPPQGRAHHYYFTLYALDKPTGLPAGATKAVLLDAIKGHVVEEAQLMGTYGRGGR